MWRGRSARRVAPRSRGGSPRRRPAVRRGDSRVRYRPGRWPSAGWSLEAEDSTGSVRSLRAQRVRAGWPVAAPLPAAPLLTVAQETPNGRCSPASGRLCPQMIAVFASAGLSDVVAGLAEVVAERAAGRDGASSATSLAPEAPAGPGWAPFGVHETTSGDGRFIGP